MSAHPRLLGRQGRSLQLLQQNLAACNQPRCSFAAAASPLNLVEKIARRHAVDVDKKDISAGNIISIKPKHVMTHDNTLAVMTKFVSLSHSEGSAISPDNPFPSIADQRQPVLALDHNVQDRSPKNLARYAAIEKFARQHGLDFFPAGRGIGHQVLCEEGYVQPGWMVVASDSHSNMYGALGALGTPVVRTDAAALWATGRTWWRVPPVARVELTGVLRQGVVGKDVILALCGLFRKDEVLNHAVEFAGDGLSCLGMEDRMTISNMTTEWGALSGVFPADGVTLKWLQARAGKLREKYGAVGIDMHEKGGSMAPPVSVPPRVLASERVAHAMAAGEPGAWERADEKAQYAKTLALDLSRLVPLVAGPNAIKSITPARSLEERRVQIHKAYILSCVNSRVSDLTSAADILRDRSVAPGVELYIAAASSEVEEESKKRGDWSALVAAGAVELPSGCGPCVGLGRGLLRDGEVAISATNRNFKGRMGSRHAQAYLASPAVVAQSALKGYIASPGRVDSGLEDSLWEVTAREIQTPRGKDASPEGPGQRGRAREDRPEVAPRAADTSSHTVISGFPPILRGAVLLTPSPNIDTDGIYAGRHCYEDMDARAQANVAMENYDPAFASLVQPGDVLVTGPNFGCGSSREQAATALRACGIRVIVTASVNETFRRNALNNALLILEAPALVAEIERRLSRSNFGSGMYMPSIRLPEYSLEVDFVASILKLVLRGGDETKKEIGGCPFDPVGRVAQEIVVAGGLEGWVRQQLQENNVLSGARKKNAA